MAEQVRVSISHPTDRPNFTEVVLGPVTVYFSYSTPVAFWGPNGRIVRENDWSVTTGRHLNWIDGGDKRGRIPGWRFMELLGEALAPLNLSLV